MFAIGLPDELYAVLAIVGSVGSDEFLQELWYDIVLKMKAPNIGKGEDLV